MVSCFWNKFIAFLQFFFFHPICHKYILYQISAKHPTTTEHSIRSTGAFKSFVALEPVVLKGSLLCVRQTSALLVEDQSPCHLNPKWCLQTLLMLQPALVVLILPAPLWSAVFLFSPCFYSKIIKKKYIFIYVQRENKSRLHSWNEFIYNVYTMLCFSMKTMECFALRPVSHLLLPGSAPSPGPLSVLCFPSLQT